MLRSLAGQLHRHRERTRRRILFRSLSPTCGRVWLAMAVLESPPTTPGQIRAHLVMMADEINRCLPPDEEPVPHDTLEQITDALAALEVVGLVVRGVGEHWRATSHAAIRA
jgi:hypothetical protein